MANYRVICGACKVPPDLVVGPEDVKQVVCPNCGATDEADGALKVAGEQFLQGNQPTLEDDEGRKFVRFDPKHLPRRSFKWHAEPV